MQDVVKNFEDRGAMPVVQDVPVTNILEYAIEKKLEPEQIEKFWEIQQKIDKENARRAYTVSMVKAQANIKKVTKNKRNDQTNSNYADLTAVCEMATPIHTAEGIALSFYEGESKKDGVARTCVDIIHDGGHIESKFIDLDIDNKGPKGTVNKTSIHGKGSSFSYARRYFTCMIFNIPTGDDNDGNSASGKPVETITEEQLSILTDLINNQKAPETQWLEWAKVESLETMPVNKFNKLKSALEAAAK